MSLLRWLLAPALLCALICPCRRAQASELRWIAPDTCPDARAARAAIERALGRTLESLASSDVHALVREEPDGRWSLALRIGPATPRAARTRELQAASCAELVDATAVAVALAADEDASAATPAPSPAAAPLPTPPSAASVRAAAASPLGFVANAGALFDLGTLPSTGIGVELELAWTYRALWLGIAGGLIPSRQMPLADSNTGQFGLFFGEVLACGQLRAGPLWGRACGSFELGAIGAALRGPAADGGKSVDWRAAGVRLGASWPLSSRIELTLSLAAIAPLTRPEFLVDYQNPVHQPAAVVGRAALGALLRL